jgi:membrane protease YdiL (CAAX protease family)
VKEDNVISPLSAVLVVVVTFILLLFLGTALYALLGPAAGMILSELLIIVAPLGYMLSKNVDIRSYVGLTIRPKNILLGITLGLLLLFFDIFVTGVLTSVLGPSKAVEESNTLIINLSSSPQGLLSVVIALVLAGICEEFTFRGFLQNAINRRYSFVPALLVSSLTFGLFHFDPQLVYIIAAFLAGLILGYVYHRWQSYVTSAVTHATVNLVVLAIALLA